MAVSRKPPRTITGPLGWMRQNLFRSPIDSVATIIITALIAWALSNLIRWILTEAVWQQIWNNFKLFAVYRYPADMLWRPLAVLALIMSLLGATAGAGRRAGKGEIMSGVYWWFEVLVLGLAIVAVFSWESVRLLWLATAIISLLGWLLGYSQPKITRALPWLWGASLPLGFLLLYGIFPENAGPGFLTRVSTKEWGGFMLTLILSAVGIGLSLPIGIVLALGRRSQLPVIKIFCIGFIELIRGAPLITWLFIGSLFVPLLLNVSPNSISDLTKAIVAVTLFSAAYMAENVRGGLQSVPKGQSEAARALGLSAWQTTRLIVLPQALRSVIPPIVGQAISLFKDTSLVFIVGLFDFFEIQNIVANQQASTLVPGGIRLELVLFEAAVYWFFAYRMSVASRQLEKQLGVGTR
ncbi:MAG TPA: amino acid ABC transporter permease [Trueperaceae bacterium]